MTPNDTVETDRAPAAIGPYSQGVWAGSLFFSAGQIGLDPVTMNMVGDDVKTQARQVMSNLERVLEAAGATFSDVVKTTIFLADMADFATVNEVYGARFEPPYPARSTVAARELPKGARVEIEVVARAR